MALGLRLSTAIAKLSYGLAHLPELSTSFQQQMKALRLVDSETDFHLVPDMEDEGSFRLMDFEPEAGPPVQPMKLEPLTAADDPEFGSRMRANINLPDYVKAIF